MSAEPRLLFETRLATRWGDQDLFAHINNVQYVRYFEDARAHWLASLGMPVNGSLGGAGLGQGPIIARVAVDYLQPVRYPAELVLGIHLGRIGTKSMTLIQTAALAEAPQQLCAKGEVVVVWYDHDRGVTLPLPAVMRGLASEGKA